MKGNNVYEDKAEKEEKRRRKRQEQLQEHTLLCPHCGKNVLDHMTKCPHCGGELTPVGYQPMDEKKIKKIKIVTFIVGMAVAIAVIACVFYL